MGYICCITRQGQFIRGRGGLQSSALPAEGRGLLDRAMAVSFRCAAESRGRRGSAAVGATGFAHFWPPRRPCSFRLRKLRMPGPVVWQGRAPADAAPWRGTKRFHPVATTPLFGFIWQACSLSPYWSCPAVRLVASRWPGPRPWTAHRTDTATLGWDSSQAGLCIFLMHLVQRRHGTDRSAARKRTDTKHL